MATRLAAPVLLVTLVLSSPAFAQAPSSGGAPPAVAEAGRQVRAAAAIVAAFGRHDPQAYFALFDPTASFVFYSTPRRLENRAAYGREWATWETELGFRVRSCTSSDQRVQIFGDTAVFTHSVRTAISTKAGESILHEREKSSSAATHDGSRSTSTK